ncbi:hypothetical protein [Serratia entomophila]|uniref:hypothetical protein n=1 Tax=Serratia entomophila TaxID=42906 RepID=UPI00217A0528|nr:hypothetical protein [Serratia entomophila]CAI0710230.1 Uncharacterised protein [Serratia entomophila]CAI1637303.1 Uncharacterised protein [Serratia entomophila]CAI1648198.1 Uncharacterised protein [Serratia entomophila]CAI1699931.1 Uncharacterised protein [Serratia entomophila]CAI1792745.1 Uncharacterised protein [Serratia entomophila]
MKNRRFSKNGIYRLLHWQQRLSGGCCLCSKPLTAHLQPFTRRIEPLTEIRLSSPLTPGDDELSLNQTRDRHPHQILKHLISG